MHIQTLRTPGLGDATYVLTHQDLAIVVDPQRDIERFWDAAREAGADVRFVLDQLLGLSAARTGELAGKRRHWL